ncbi:hypothetical protein EKPJFOCH_3902 [Methylobacterium thuringiense]|uniref:Uncharacterized protein n=1 Tax=Methylobacterium thuringiense TaxID=1003091 RepID=A0ABQ4TPW0_9HYPH|nr:hypothetical protein EKPJFOCH_3902 [Methylobacterium thuringiense]
MKLFGSHLRGMRWAIDYTVLTYGAAGGRLIIVINGEGRGVLGTLCHDKIRPSADVQDLGS